MDFSISRKRVSTVKPCQEGEFVLHGHENFFRDPCSFPYIKTLLKVSDPVFEKNLTRVNNLKIAEMVKSEEWFTPWAYSFLCTPRVLKFGTQLKVGKMYHESNIGHDMTKCDASKTSYLNCVTDKPKFDHFLFWSKFFSNLVKGSIFRC